jgi:hypothetical protein
MRLTCRVTHPAHGSGCAGFRLCNLLDLFRKLANQTINDPLIMSRQLLQFSAANEGTRGTRLPNPNP